MIGLGLIYPRAAGKRRVRNPPSRTCGRGGRPGLPRHVTWVRKCIAVVYVSMLLCGLFTARAPHAVYTCRAAHTYGSTGGSCWGPFLRARVAWRFDSILGWNRRWGARTKIFDSTLGYPGEGPAPEWQGDDMSVLPDQPDLFTSLVFLNADGASVRDDPNTDTTPHSLDTLASIAEMLRWNTACIGLGDAQSAAESNSLQLMLHSGECPIWPSCRWVRSPLRARPAGIPGGTCLGVSEALARRVIATYELHSTFGWFTGVLLHGKDIDGTPSKLAIITVYCPLYKAAGGSWGIMQERLTKIGSTRDPAQQFYHELTELVRDIHNDGAKVIIGGDFNTAYDKADRYSNELESLLRRGGLEHVLSHKHPTVKFDTYVHSDSSDAGRTCPDAVYASVGLTASSITRVGVRQRQYVRSRHRPIVVEVNVHSLLGAGLTKLAPNTSHLLQHMLPRVLTHSDVPMTDKYSAVLADTWAASALEERITSCATRSAMALEVGWTGENSACAPCATESTADTRVNWQQEFDALLADVESSLLQCELGLCKKIPTHTPSWPDGWSDDLVDAASSLRACTHVLRMARKGIREETVDGDYLRASWATTGNHIQVLPPADDNIVSWTHWVRDADKARKSAIRETGVKWRKERRAALTDAVQKRDQLYEDNKVKRYIQKIIGTNKSRSGQVLLVRDPITGTPALLTDPEAIKASETKVMNEWMGHGRKRWFLSPGATLTDHPTLADTKEGWARRRTLQRDTSRKHSSHWSLPPVFDAVFQASRVKHSKLTGVPMESDVYERALHPFTWGEFASYLAVKAKNTAPGKSGVRYAHLHFAPEHIQRSILLLLNAAFQRRIVFDSWRDELIYRTEKVPGDPDQMNKRPLKLQNVLRKLWIGMLKNRVVKVWYQHGLIDEDQHAFLRGKSTATPIYTRKMALADAQYRRLFAAMGDVDLHHAYDQTERWVKEMSLRRFGVPEDVLDYLAEFDRGNRNFVLTAFGPGKGFEATMGAYAQGDDFSPLGWVCTMDWKLAVCAAKSTAPYVVRDSMHTTACMSRCIYADDGTYIQAGKQMSRRERQRAMARSFNGTGGAIRTLARQQASHLQGLLDGVELFCGCTGHEIKTKKSHVLILMWLVDTTGGAVEWPTALASALVIRRWLPSNTRWEPVLGPEEAFPLAMPSAEKRHLGHFQDAYGNSTTALKALTHDTLSRASRIARSRALPAPAQYLCRAVLYNAAAYKLRFMNVPSADIARVESGVKRLLCNTSHVHMSVPDALKYGTRGGMNWEPWPDKVNIQRLTDAMGMLMNGGKDATLMRAEFDRLQMWVGSARRALRLDSSHRCAIDTPHTNLWSVGLWQWMMHPNRELTISGRHAGPEYAHCYGDAALQESNTAAHTDRQCLRRARWRWRVRMLSDLVACDGRTLLPKWWPNQVIASADPSGWRAITLAAHTSNTKLVSTQLQPPPLHLAVGSVVASVHPVDLQLGMCTALEGDLVHLVELNEVDCRAVYRAHVASTDWSSTNKLLTHPRIRAFISLGRSYTINKARVMVIDHVLPPLAGPTSRRKVPGGDCSMFGAITQGTGKYATSATRRLRALIFFTDRELTAMISKRLTARATARPERPQPSSFVGRAKASNLVNMVPEEVRSTIPLATQPWEHYKRRGYTMFGASDGSGEKNDGQSGAYAWIIVAARTPLDMYILHRGWGWECIRANRARGLIDSTRMEFAGIAAGVTFAMTHYADRQLLPWYCDSKSAVGEIPKLHGRTTNQWLAASNTDIGHYLSDLPTQALRRVKVQWRRGHPERRMDTEQYEMHDHMNVACDALASAVPHHRSDVDCQCEHNNAAPTHLHSCVLHKLPGQPIRVCYMGKPIVSRMAHTIMRYVQANYSLQYLQSHRPGWWGEGANIDWRTYDQWNARMRSPSRRAANMKLLWDKHLTNAYAATTFKRGDGKCRCGAEAETSAHVLHRCLCPANLLGREQLVHHIHSSLRALWSEGELQADWEWFLTKMFELDHKGATCTWTRGEEPAWSRWAQEQQISGDLKSAISRWIKNGSECNWKGLFPPDVCWILQQWGMSPKRATKWINTMRDILLDGGATIWRLRCREANEGEIPDSEFTAHLRTRAAELWRNIESEAPAQEREHRAVTCEQIRAIHPHRLRRYVRTLEQRLSARRAPTIVLRLTRPQVEVNPLAEFVGNDEAAMRDPPRANRMALDASCSEVKATRHAAGASGHRKSASRYAYDIHRQMGPQRVHSRPTFHYGASNRQRCQVRHEVHVADGRAKSTAERLEIFACTGVTASEYEVLLPGGMRREALGAGSTHACYQERIDLVQRSRRKLARTRLRANRTAATNTAVRTAEPVAPQRLAPPASVRGRLERPGLINANKRRWHMMCSGAALPSAHSTTARSGTCASARASDTHTPGRPLLLRTDDQQTDTDCDTLHCARASARARRGGTTTADFNSTHTGEPLHKGAGPPPRRAGNQPTDSDHDTPDCARSRARLDDNNTSADDTPDCARSRARSDESNTTDEDTRDSARSRARSDDSNERQKRDRGSTPGAAAQHRGAVHPLVSSTHRAASADAVAGLALASENEQRGGARGDAHQNQGTGNDSTKRGRGGSKKEKKLENYFSKKPRKAAESGV